MSLQSDFNEFLPFNRLDVQFAREADWLRPAVDAVLQSGRFIGGEPLGRFERAFATAVGRRECVGVANGTDALELALRATGIGPGDRVICAANAGSYASTAIRACGASPLYVDIEPNSPLIDAARLDGTIPCKPGALILTHLYGQCADAVSIAAWCAEHGVSLIEDCAQAHGARIDERPAGSFGALACYSFYPTKNLGALGDGGALVCDDPELATRVRALAQYGWTARYHATMPGGRNSRLDTLQAAVLAARLPHLGEYNARRRAIARAYDSGIRQPDIVLPRFAAGDVAHLYVVRSQRRDKFAAHLRDLGVGCEVHYPFPDHHQPAHAVDVTLPNTETACSEVLSLPCHPCLSDAECERVIDACNRFH